MLIPLQTLDRAVQLLEQLAELTDPAAFAPTVLPALAELIGCDVITYNEVGTSPSRVHYDDWPTRALDASTNQTFSHLVHQHPSVQHYRLTGDTTPVMISDFLTRSQFHRLDLYGEFFRQIPVEYQLSLSLGDAVSPVIGIALNRARTDFDELDRAVLAILRRPLLTALKRASIRQSATSSSELTQLSARELAIMRLVALGRTNIAIAHTIGISPRTVAKHLEHIYRKLDVTCRAAAVAQTRESPADTEQHE